VSLLSFLHPLWKRSLNEYDDSVNSAVIGALNQSLSKSEEDMVQSKVESYLSTADSKWLDYWGYWFGERRKSGWSDDYYRSRIVNHVEHARGTVDALRDAIADFINTNKDNIYIYEPYRDMFIWNSSKYNTKKYFSSTYYRYAVIDIQISASYPKEIVSIINLFRPAGVLWVLTETVNSRNSDAPIIDIKNPKDVFVPKIENDFIFGLRTRTRLVINPSKDDYETVTNPFTYNKKDSLFNDRNSLFMGATQISKRYSFIGQSLFDYTPKDNDTLEDSSYNVEQLNSSDIASVATKNGRGKMFDFNPAKNNLVSNASQYLTPTTISSYSQRYDMPTNYLKEGQTYNFAVNINSNTNFSNTKTDLILDSKNKNLLRDSTTQIKNNLATIVKEGNQWLTTQFTIPEGFNLDTGPYLSFSGSDSNISFNVSKPIIKSTANTNPMSWAQSADEETNTPTKLADTIDLRGFINDNYKTLSTTVTNKELNDLFDTKKLHLVIKTVNSQSGSLTIRFFNFNTNLWVTYGNFEVIGSYTDIFVKLDDITPLMNKNSLIYISMEFSNDKSISVSLDYIGLSLSNSEDGYSIKMFADQSSYGSETEVAMGPFIISKSSVSRAYISPSRYNIGDPEYGKIGHYPLA